MVKYVYYNIIYILINGVVHMINIIVDSITYCPDCGEVVECDWKFCPHCNGIQKKTKCLFCKKEINGQWNFCPYCKKSLKVKSYIGLEQNGNAWIKQILKNAK